jgi:hypothetical protein
VASDGAALLRGVEVATPARGDEVVGSVVGEVAAAAAVELPEDLDGGQQRPGGGAALEGEGGEHGRGELPQVGVASLEQLEVATVAGHPLPRRADGGAKALHPDALAQARPDLVISHRGVDEDGEQLVEQTEAVLDLLGPGQGLLGQVVSGSTIGAGEGLVEQPHDLVEDLGRRLGHRG